MTLLVIRAAHGMDDDGDDAYTPQFWAPIAATHAAQIGGELVLGRAAGSEYRGVAEASEPTADVRAKKRKRWSQVPTSSETKMNTSLLINGAKASLQCDVPRSGGGSHLKVLADFTFQEPLDESSAARILARNIDKCTAALDIMVSKDDTGPPLREPVPYGKVRKFINSCAALRGSLRRDVQLALAFADISDMESPLLFLSLTNSDANCSVMYEDCSADGTYRRLLESLGSNQRAQEHTFVSVASPHMGKNAPHFHLCESKELNSCHYSRHIAKLLSNLEDATKRDSNLSFIMILRPHKDLSGVGVECGGFRCVGEAFDTKAAVHAVKCAMEESLTLPGSPRYRRVLRSLFEEQYTEARPSNIEASYFFSAFSPCALLAALDLHEARAG